MTTILVLIGGGARDEVIFRTALAAAIPLSAHLDMLHVYVSAGIAAQHDQHVQFAMGASLYRALDHLETSAKAFSEVASDHVRAFCSASNIEMRDAPTNGKNVTASYRDEKNTSKERLIFHARQSDLIVMGRARQAQGLAPDTLEYLVRNCGRPVLLAATGAPQTPTGTIMICWKKSENLGRAIAAAMPILANAKRLVIASISKRNKGDDKDVHDFARQFGDRGIPTEVRVVPLDTSGISGLLSAAAADCGADLVVMGGYGRSRFRELVFGSCTEAILRDIDRPILLMH